MDHRKSPDEDHSRRRHPRGRLTVGVGAALLIFGVLAATSHAGGMNCRKVVSKEASGEPRNALKASRVKCGSNEFLTGGVCYPEVRPEPDGSCQTSAMGIIQTLAEWPGTTRGAFFTCLQTGGTECPVEERTRAMAICCTDGSLGDEEAAK